MRRLLRFGCITVIVIAVLAVILAALGSRQTQTAQPQVASENTAAPQITEDTEPLDGPAQEPTAPAPPPTVVPTAVPQPEQVAATDGRCEPVRPDVVSGIESGLTVDGGGTLRGAQAVRSQDFEQVWFVAADIQGAGLEGDGDVAVWAMNDISAPGAGLTIAVNAVAKEFSVWGAADQSQRFTPGDDGVSEAEECVANALQSQSASPRELALDYLQPDQRSGDYAGFAVRFINNTDAEITNPQTRVVVELGGTDWACQGYGDPVPGEPITGVMDVLGSPLVIPAGQEVPVTIYCRIPEAPLDTARLRLR